MTPLNPTNHGSSGFFGVLLSREYFMLRSCDSLPYWPLGFAIRRMIRMIGRKRTPFSSCNLLFGEHRYGPFRMLLHKINILLILGFCLLSDER